MFIIKTKNYNEMSKRTAEIIVQEVLKKPNLVIGFATGKTPLGLYKELVKAFKNKKVSFSKITCFNLDEYYPIKKENKNSYNFYMFKNFFSKVNIKRSNINLLNGETKNPEKECEEYEKKIKKNPIDLQILGVGVNGHIAFNEPGSDFNSKTKLVILKHKAVTEKALTMGIRTIISAKKIIVLASGKNKAKAVKKLVEGDIDSPYPVSFLKKHRRLIVIIDKDAGSLLKRD